MTRWWWQGYMRGQVRATLSTADVWDTGWRLIFRRLGKKNFKFAHSRWKPFRNFQLQKKSSNLELSAYYQLQLPFFHLLSIPWLSSFLGLRFARAPWIVESCFFGLVTWSKLTWRKWKKYKTWRCFRGLQLRCSPVLQLKYSRVLQLRCSQWIKFCKLLNQITIFYKCIFRGKTIFNICPIQTCIAIKSFHKLVKFLQTPLVHRQAW